MGSVNDRSIAAICAYPLQAMPAAQGVELGGMWIWRGTIVLQGSHHVLWRCCCEGHGSEGEARICSEAEWATGADASERGRDLLYDIATGRG
jgi:hypothetical protein